MYPFFESIRVQDGFARELEAHQQRVNRCLKSHNGLPLDIEELASQLDLPSTGLYKWRLQYGLEGNHQSRLSAYVPSHPEQLRVVCADHILYPHKYEDRKAISQLLQQAQTSDIIMTQKGLITDSSYANLVFYNGLQWFTPKIPLLAGTQRALLLERGTILEADISLEDLAQFIVFKRINAMMTFESSLNLPINLISPV